ncbi:hypothetical protein [Candidatus Stoquefichus sp. SB1]|uniref:hypothetical protein n=1 Tax=Candidatus Stoquefichus sp. SB1 TaxID=1658109 RepID=UPI0012FE9BF9|nr:hypothetical protein [Candidatus Stoquefichus sp. SB1]
MKEKISFELMILFAVILFSSNFIERSNETQMIIGLLLLGSFISFERYSCERD